MAYRFKRKDKSVEAAVRRIASEQIDNAISAIDHAPRADAIHDMRKRCKKLRGLIRLVRPGFDGYSQENARFRACAQLISGQRDAKVMQDTYDLLMQHYQDQVERRALSSIRRRFTLERKDQMQRCDTDDQLPELRDRLLKAREDSQDWALEAKGWDALGGGLKKTYGRAREAAGAALTCPGGETFHELRKRIKYHWYHCRLLENLWPAMMGVRMETASSLSDILGNHHDLVVFEARLTQDGGNFGNPGDVETAIALAKARQSALEQEAWPLVEQLLAQPADALAQHFGAMWNIWHDIGDRAARLGEG